MTNKELFNILVSFYSSEAHERVYSGRWDVWCIQNNNWTAYHLLILKTDDQLNNILGRAKAHAYMLEDSPLGRALK